MTEKAKSEKQRRFKFKRECNACQPITFSEKRLKDELLIEARVIGIPTGVAEIIVAKVAERVNSWVAGKPAVTSDDVHRRVAMEAEKYSADLAYVYQNRGKII